MSHSILALDLDGTLTNSRKEITERTLNSVRAAAGMGTDIVLASGRPVLGIKPLSEQLGLDRLGGYILAYNGAEIIDCMTGKTIFKKELPYEYYQWICETAREFGVNALTYDSEGILAESDTARYVMQEAINNNTIIKKVEKLEDVVKECVPKFMIVGEPEKINEVMEFMLSKTGDDISIFLSEPYFLEITAKGVKKDTSLDCLIKYLGKSRNELVAIGDGLNDLSMFGIADLAIAMDNASDEVKSHADVVTDNNDRDGVAKAIEKYILGQEG